MNGHLPPLSALRAFEAAARLKSFSKAAEELNVTPAAISHQIHALEQDLGVQLFRRLNRAVELTASARVLLPGLTEAFAGLGHTEGAFPVTEQASGELLSLPLFAEITEGQQERVAEALTSALR